MVRSRPGLLRLLALTGRTRLRRWPVLDDHDAEDPRLYPCTVEWLPVKVQGRSRSCVSPHAALSRCRAGTESTLTFALALRDVEKGRYLIGWSLAIRQGAGR